jgi:hypothetical protein
MCHGAVFPEGMCGWDGKRFAMNLSGGFPQFLIAMTLNDVFL